MNWIKTIYHWCYRAFWYTLVTLILFVALSISFVRFYISDVEDHKEDIENFASKLLDHDVLIDSMQAKLQGFTPVIIFSDVNMLDKTGKKTIMRFAQARMTIDLFRSIYNFKVVPESLTISGVQLAVSRNQDGSFAIQGLDVSKLGDQIATTSDAGASDDISEWLFKRSRLAIERSSVVWTDIKNGKKVKFDNVNLQLLNDGDRHQLNGTVSPPRDMGRDLQVAFDFTGNVMNPNEWSGDVYARAEEVNLQNWGVKPEFRQTRLEEGSLNLELWGKWERGSVNSFSANVRTNAIKLKLDKKDSEFKIGQISGLVNWKRLETGWKLAVNDFKYVYEDTLWPASTVVVEYNSKQEAISAYAGYLKIEDIKQALVKGKLVDKDIEAQLVKFNPRGKLTDVYLDFSFNDNAKDYYLSANFDSISIDERKDIPGIKNLSGKIVLNDTTGRLSLDSSGLEVKHSSMFRQPIVTNRFSGDFDLIKGHKSWHARSSNIRLESDDITADLDLNLMFPQKGSPHVDLLANYKNGIATSAKKYLPVGVMDKELINWLDHAFMSGKETDGNLIFHGRLNDFPFADHSGTFIGSFNAVGVKLNYYPGWPTLFVHDANIEISGLHTSVSSDRATLYNSTLTDVRVSIDDFRSPVIRANGKFYGNTEDPIRYLVESPIAPEAKELVAQTKIQGKSSGTVTLQLPLLKTAEKKFPLSYNCKVSVVNNKVDLWNGKIVATKANADLTINQKGIFSNNISFKHLGGPVQAKLITKTKRRQQNYQVSFIGKMDGAKIKEHVPHPVFDKISGFTNWQGTLNIGVKDDPGSFRFVSSLKGLGSDLPYPLNKAASELKPLRFNVQFPVLNKVPITVKYADIFSTRLVIDLAQNPKALIERGEIVFSTTEKKDAKKREAKFPIVPGLFIKGHLSDLNIDHWAEFFAQKKNDVKTNLTDINVPVRLDMDYLKVVRNAQPEQQEQDKQDDLPQAIDPRNIGLLDVNIRRFVYNDKDFGHVQVKTEREADGIRFRDAFIKAPYMTVTLVEGSWLFLKNRSQTNLLFTLASDDLGTMLARLGYAATLKNGKTVATIHTYWFDSPYRFSVEKLNGTIATIVDDGVIRDIKPGAGRLLGLFSMTELPRRLLLDFGEFHQGLVFKQIVGQIEFKDGDAFLDQFTINSSIAFITIEGRTGLAKRDFNQHISVSPSISSTIPVLTWITMGGGPAALVFLLDKLLGDEMNRSIAEEYVVTGSWENPVITKVKSADATENRSEEGD